MSLIRFQLDLAIPENVYNAIPAAKKLAIRDMVRSMKALAVKINEGKDNEEDTVVARYHICGHDEGKACEPVEEI